MVGERVYEVLLLPLQEVAGRFVSLREAAAWMRTYNEAAGGGALVAVVGERRFAVSSRATSPRSRRGAGAPRTVRAT